MVLQVAVDRHRVTNASVPSNHDPLEILNLVDWCRRHRPTIRFVNTGVNVFIPHCVNLSRSDFWEAIKAAQATYEQVKSKCQTEKKSSKK